MAVAMAARPLVPSAACAPWRGGAQARVSVPMAAAPVDRLRAGEKLLAFGRELPAQHRRRSCSFVGVHTSQQSLEAAPIPAGYQTSVEQVKGRLASERADLPVGKNGRDDEDLILWLFREGVDFFMDKKMDALLNSHTIGTNSTNCYVDPLNFKWQ